MPSLDQLAHLLRATLEDATRVTALMDTALQQAPHPTFELSHDGVIWYLNTVAADTLGITPTQAVGTRLSNYVEDGLMTQRRLESLKREPVAQSWPDRWRRHHEVIPCRMTAFPMPETLRTERPRVILWSEQVGALPQAVRTEHPSGDSGRRASPFFSDTTPIYGRDLDPFLEALGIKLHRICEYLGVTTLAWYKWRREPDEPIGSRTIELHLRLLDAYPDLTKAGAHPLDLQETLRAQRGIEVSLNELALLLGIEARTAYAWGHGQPVSGPIQGLTASLLHMLVQKPRYAWDEYRQIVDRQAEREGASLWETKSWTRAAESSSILAANEPTHRRGRGRRKRVQDNRMNRLSEPSASTEPTEQVNPAKDESSEVENPRSKGAFPRNKRK